MAPFYRNANFEEDLLQCFEKKSWLEKMIANCWQIKKPQ